MKRKIIASLLFAFSAVTVMPAGAAAIGRRCREGFGKTEPMLQVPCHRQDQERPVLQENRSQVQGAKAEAKQADPELTRARKSS